MKLAKQKIKICSRGHKYWGSGPCLVCWPGGAKKIRTPAKAHKTYHNDGSLWAKGTMKGGKMEGYWEWFRKPARTERGSARSGRPMAGNKRGTRMRSGYFKNGAQTGVWTTYDKNGKVVKKTVFKEK